jgi:small subunit ribosomal protein S16
MIVIRLTRIGKKKQPSYRLVVQEKKKDPWGKALDIVGFYNPRSKPKTIKFDADRIKSWLAKGATASPSVHNLLVDAKVVSGAKKPASHGKQKRTEGGEAKKEEVKK